MRASASFNFDDGMTTSSWNAVFAFRRRVSMSAIGSVIVTAAPSSPRRLGDAGNLAGVHHLAHADPAQPETAVHRARPPTPPTARVATHLELRLRLLLDHECLLSHLYCSAPAPSLLLRSRSATRGD